MMIATVVLLFSVKLVDALSGFEFVERHYYPAGYANGTNGGVPDLYGYGFGALERSYYDSKQKLFYGGSELGFVTITDFSDGVKFLDIGFPLTNSLTDIKVCGDYLFVTTKDDPNPGMLQVYTAAMRAEDGSFVTPTLIQSLEVGYGPDNILVSKDCSIIATANEGEGDYPSEEEGLINPVGSVSILRGPFDDPQNPPSNTLISLDLWTDEELIEMGVHLPLPRNALIYWNNSLDVPVNFDAVIDSYSTDMNLEPEYLAFGDGETKIYANLQENNAVVVIDVATNNVTGIYAYGLKFGFPVDVVEDEGCELMPVVDGLYFLRSADSIATFEQNGTTYLITANEGDDVEYGEYAEKVKAGDIFDGTTIAFVNMTANASIFDPTNPTLGQARYFNGACNETNAATSWCASGMRLTIGSATVDYSDPQAPNIYRLTAIGGRGITIYKINDDGLEMVWDSDAEFETAGCAAYPWAHNGIQDEEFAAVNGTFYNSLEADDDLRETIEEMNSPDEDGCTDSGNGSPGACPLGQTVDERSMKDGYAAETVVVGEACGSLYAVTVSEKNSVGFLYDITNPASPSLEKVFHLSPASESLSPELAYNQRTLGEIDAESIQFLIAEESLTGKAAVLFSGAFSGTTSLWEFICDGDAATATPTSGPVLEIVEAPTASQNGAPTVEAPTVSVQATSSVVSTSRLLLWVGTCSLVSFLCY